MQTDLIPFAFEDRLVRVLTDENGNPWFVAKDVCAILELGNPRSSVALLDEDEKGVCTVDTLGGPQEMATVSESGLYSLFFRSRKPAARRFRKWVTSEVLPALRKTGSYAMPGRVARAALPEHLPLPEEALSLRPSLREKLWNDALQTARLDNGGSDDALRWFAALCRMVSAHRTGTSSWEAARQFMDACLVPAPGRRLDASTIHQALRRWWREQEREGPPPSQKVLGEALGTVYRGRNSNGRYYLDVAFKM